MKKMDQLIDSKYPSQMVFKGSQAGGTSWNGIDIDVLKSGIQKYIRRGYLEKALWCVYELDLFHEMYERDPSKHTGLKALSTNCIHRLLITSIEDIGIGNPSLPLLVDRLVQAYKRDRFNPSLKDKRREYLYVLTKVMCESKRTRELSHIRSVFSQVFNFDGKEYTTDGSSFHRFSLEDLKKQYPNIYNFTLDVIDPSDEYMRFQEEFKKGSDACFYWFFKLFSRGNSLSTCRHQVSHLLSFVLDETKLQPDSEELIRVMSILRDWFREYNFKEYVLFAMQIILLGLRRPHIDNLHELDVLSAKILSPTCVFKDEWEGYYMRNVNGSVIIIDDFVVDKHTRKGRKIGKDLAVFAKEGAYVTNEYKDTVQDYKKIYTEFRQYRFQEVSISKDTDSRHLCEATYSHGDKKGLLCGNIGKYSVTIEGVTHWYCGVHARGKVNHTGPISTIAQCSSSTPLQFSVTHTLSLEQIRTLFSPHTPRGQLLCGKHKKQVLIPYSGEFKGYVIKGPWKSTDIQRLNTMLFRMRVMNTLKVRCIPFSIVNGEDGNGYTVYRNISPIDPSLWEIDTVHDANIPVQDLSPESTHISYGMDIARVDRSSMGITQMNNLPPQQQRELLFGEHFVFKGLIILALLHVGDVGLYNILVTQGIPYIIDYEETTSRRSFSSLGNFLSKPIQKYTSIFFNGIRDNQEKILSLIREVDTLLPKIIKVAEKHGVSYNITLEWNNIKGVLKGTMI